MGDEATPQNTDFARQYGTNWTITNVNTLYEWVNIAAFNIRCLELSIQYYRRLIRNQTVLGLIFSTLSGTISVSQYNGNDSSSAQNLVLNILFTIFTFSIAITAGALKIYQIQERLEASIKLKQDWIVFSTAITSELQLPIELRRDALFMIKRHKDTYLDLMKTEVEISEKIKQKAITDLPPAPDNRFDVATLPRIMINICNQELADMKSENARNKDRFSKSIQKQKRTPADGITSPELNTVNTAFPNAINLVIAPSTDVSKEVKKPELKIEEIDVKEDKTVAINL